MKGLRTVVYKVPDLAQAKLWYSEAFGTKPYFDEPFYVGFNIGGYELGLQPLEEDSVGTNVITYWGVDGITETYKKLLDMGAQSHEALTNVGGPVEIASIFDPWQNIIGIIYNPTFKISN